MDMDAIKEIKATIKEQVARVTEEKGKQNDFLDKYRLEKVELHLDLAVDELVNILLFPHPNI